MKKIALLLLAMLSMPRVHSQQLLWGVGFDTRFDNREYSGSSLATSQTLFSSRLSPTIGLEWSKGSSIVAGADLRLDFGAARQFDTPPQVVMYYNYDSPKYKAVAGVFPRTKMAGDYSSAFFSDSVRFYDNNIEGFLLQYAGRSGNVELGLDWDGMYSKERRESFRIFSAGVGRLGSFYGGYAFSMYHLASLFRCARGGGLHDFQSLRRIRLHVHRTGEQVHSKGRMVAVVPARQGRRGQIRFPLRRDYRLRVGELGFRHFQHPVHGR
ncbi:MAG: hypothetical protein L6V35_05700 [Alistipes putredinis]|nr:MAG: hypothetical protein L6V35_05700 [Alistipes putredinis]